jgi:DNA-binding NtrC family response regulator
MSEQIHVLVVEDDPLVSEVIAAALEDRFRTTIAENAAVALRCLQEGGVGLVLLDCTLPGGLDPALLPAADQISAPVILMSGDISRVEHIGGQGRPFILKPFTLVGLVDAVERVVGPA